MSPYTEGQDDLAVDILAVLNSPLSVDAKLAKVRTLVENCLPSPPPPPAWTGSGPGYTGRVIPPIEGLHDSGDDGRPYDPRD
jgi:hypothetical protein